MKRLLSAWMILLLLFSTLSSCSLFEKNQEEYPDESSSGNIVADIDNFNPTVFELYPSVGAGNDVLFSTFLKVSYEAVLDEIFYTSDVFDGKAILAKFTVVEDYYGKLEEGDTVYVPYVISYSDVKDGYGDEESTRNAIISFLEESDFFFFAYRRYTSDLEALRLYVEAEDVINNRKRYTIEAEEGVCSYVASGESLTDFHVIPLNDGRLDLYAVDRVVYETTGWDYSDNYAPSFDYGRHYLYYDNYFYQGMPESEIPGALDRLNEDRKLYN